MDPNGSRSPKRASPGPYNLRKRAKTTQHADTPPTSQTKTGKATKSNKGRRQQRPAAKAVEETARQKWCLKRLLVTFNVAPEKLEAVSTIRPEKGAIGSQADEESVAGPSQAIEVQESSRASSRLRSADQNADSPAPQSAETSVERAFANVPSPDRSEILEMEARLFASENENVRMREEVKAFARYTPNARLTHTLRKHLENASLMHHHTRTFNVNHPVMYPKEISNRYSSLSEFIRYGCFTACADDPAVPDELISHSELVESWANQSFGQDFKNCISQVRQHKFQKRELLMGLVASAFIEMVFEPAFPAFLQASNPLAEEYRQVILNLAGAAELHKADINVLIQLINPRTSEIVERRAEELQRILHKHLDFFWSSPNGEDGNPEKTPTPRRPFENTISQAVEFKLDLMMTTTRLKFFYYKPDEPFDDERMERCPFSDREKNTIKACLFPALLFAPAREPTADSDDYVLEHNIQFSMYFTRILGGDLPDLKLAAKAIVLT
ncbi:hypothetical protein IL306_012150 [Fusarium sp. DS 682]|nr:hypothetical protein IL306_012150 [Fusarium sp. DS 682]